MLFIAMNHCSQSEIQGIWYLDGGRISFLFTEETLTVIDEGQTLYKAKLVQITEYTKKYQIVYVNTKVKTAIKYKKDQYIIFSKILYSDEEITLTYNYNDFSKAIHLYKNKNNIEHQFYNRLYPVEIEEFLLDEQYSNLLDNFNIQLYSNSLNSKKLSFLCDGNSNRSWTSQKKIDFSNIFIELFFKNKGNQDLKNQLRITALGFIVRSQNSFKDKQSFHRVKEVEVRFCRNYNGGIGLKKAYYENPYFKIKLKDQPGLQLFYFYKPVFAIGMKLKIREIYPGLPNNLKINEVVIYKQN